MTDMQGYAERGYIDKAPHFNSISNAVESAILTPILKAMIEESARPLREIETDFAADSTGFSSCVYERWFDAKFGRERSIAKYVKGHMMVGTTTNVVTSVEVTPAYVSDYEMFTPLLKSTVSRFNVTNVSADKAYSGRSNFAAMEAVGVNPLIPFKVNANSRGSEFWKQTFAFFHNNRHEFLAVSSTLERRDNIFDDSGEVRRVRALQDADRAGERDTMQSARAQLVRSRAVVLRARDRARVLAAGTPALSEARPVGWFRNLPERQPWSGPRKGQRAPVRRHVTAN